MIKSSMKTVGQNLLQHKALFDSMTAERNRKLEEKNEAQGIVHELEDTFSIVWKSKMKQLVLLGIYSWLPSSLAKVRVRVTMVC